MGKSENQIGQREMAARRKISSVWQNMHEDECDHKVLCHIQYTHSDVNLQGEQATTSNTQQTSITTFALRPTDAVMPTSQKR